MQDTSAYATAFKQAGDLFRQGKIRDALPILRRLETEAPPNAQVLHAAALCHERLGQHDEALQRAERLVAEFNDARGYEIIERIGPQLSPLNLNVDLGLDDGPAFSSKATSAPPPVDRQPDSREKLINYAVRALVAVPCGIVLSVFAWDIFDAVFLQPENRSFLIRHDMPLWIPPLLIIALFFALRWFETPDLTGFAITFLLLGGVLAGLMHLLNMGFIFGFLAGITIAAVIWGYRIFARDT